MNIFYIIPSLAIKWCEISNDDETKNFVLIEDYCETEQSGPIVQKDLEGCFFESWKNLAI